MAKGKKKKVTEHWKGHQTYLEEMFKKARATPIDPDVCRHPYLQKYRRGYVCPSCTMTFDIIKKAVCPECVDEVCFT